LLPPLLAFLAAAFFFAGICYSPPFMPYGTSRSRILGIHTPADAGKLVCELEEPFDHDLT